jgi:hypothetical protein
MGTTAQVDLKLHRDHYTILGASYLRDPYNGGDDEAPDQVECLCLVA